MAAEVTLTQRKQLAENLAKVRDQIAAAAARAGRQKEEITLVAVTKYVSVEVARALYDLGCADLGESRPQELWNKAEALKGAAIRWHLIGHLQRNKIRKTLPFTTLLHSLDRESIVEDVHVEAIHLGRLASVLLEVNISGDASKHGFTFDDVKMIIDARDGFPHLRILGLMGMSGLHSDDNQRRGQFAALRLLGDRLAEMWAFNGASCELSMGMSEDFQIAIEEGATIVRVGSALFEGVVD